MNEELEGIKREAWGIGPSVEVRDLCDYIAKLEKRIEAVKASITAIDLAQLEAVKEKKCCDPS